MFLQRPTRRKASTPRRGELRRASLSIDEETARGLHDPGTVNGGMDHWHIQRSKLSYPKVQTRIHDQCATRVRTTAIEPAANTMRADEALFVSGGPSGLG